MKKKAARRTRKVEVTHTLQALAIDSNYEPVTKAAYAYREKHVYPYLESKGLEIVRCQGQMARRIYAAPAAKKAEVVYITGVGHGSYTTYTGDHYDPIFSVGQYQAAEAAGKVIHLLSCQTAAELGPDMVASGCKAYFGYDVNFTFVLADADVFFECDSEIDYALADGLTAGAAYDRARALFDEKIDELDAAGKTYVASILELDRDHLCAPSVDARWGSKQAKIE